MTRGIRIWHSRGLRAEVHYTPTITQNHRTAIRVGQPCPVHVSVAGQVIVERELHGLSLCLGAQQRGVNQHVRSGLTRLIETGVL